MVEALLWESLKLKALASGVQQKSHLAGKENHQFQLLFLHFPTFLRVPDVF